MAQFLIHVGRHWLAMLVSIFLVCRLWRGDFNSSLAMWFADGLTVAGITMNLAVILINRGMPADVTSDEISDEERPHYHPISPTTRLAFLADWIPVGDLLVSPGDIVLFVAIAILLIKALFGV